MADHSRGSRCTSRPPLARRRRGRQALRQHLPRLESLEQRLVLSFTPAADTDPVTGPQAAALF